MKNESLNRIVGEHVEKLSILTRAKAFLGREFLTWLWCQAETKKGKITLQKWNDGPSRDIEIWIDDLISLESSSSKIHEHQMKGGNPSHSQEATVALAGGKMVKDLKIGLRMDGVGEFTAMLKSEDLNPRSLRLPEDDPAAMKVDGDETSVHRRVRLVQVFYRMLDGLFAQFLEERASDHWQERGLPELRSWIESRRENHQVTVLH